STRYNIDDDEHVDISGVAIQAMFDIITEVVLQGGRVLVHCHAGISRSATVIILAVMLLENRDFDTAFRQVRQIRKICEPNPGFRHFLKCCSAVLYGSEMHYPRHDLDDLRQKLDVVKEYLYNIRDWKLIRSEYETN